MRWDHQITVCRCSKSTLHLHSTVQYSTVQCCTAPHLYRPASSARSPAIWRLERPELDMRKLYLRMRTASHEVTPPPRPPGRGGHAGVSPVGGGEAALHLVISKQVTLTHSCGQNMMYISTRAANNPSIFTITEKCLNNSVLNVKALVGAFNHKKVLVGGASS